MSDWDDYDDDDTQGQDGPDLVKDLRKQIKDRTKREKELQETLAGLQAQVRERTVADVLREKGVPTKVAKLVPESVETSEEAVGKWLDDYKDLFGTTEKPEGESNTQTSSESTVPPDQQAAMIKVAETGATGQVPQSSYQEQLEKVRNASPDELLQMIAAAQQGAAA